MRSSIRNLLLAFGLLWPAVASAQGVIPVALAQQSDINGRPLAGALLYIFQVGTVATPQNAFQDFGLTLPYPWPLRADQFGRIPMFYLANGQVHARLTDASGVVQFDVPNLQVIGPSSGGGGGGGGVVDPTTIFAPGDFKWRATSEAVVGWVKANGQSIGTAGCIGCTGRTNTDTQALYIYLWANCTNAHCPVGRRPRRDGAGRLQCAQAAHPARPARALAGGPRRHGRRGRRPHPAEQRHFWRRRQPDDAGSDRRRGEPRPRARRTRRTHP